MKSIKFLILGIALISFFSCGVTNKVRYTRAKEIQLYNFTDWVIVDSVTNKHVYCHDVDSYRIHIFNLDPDILPLKKGDSLHLKNMYDPNGIEIIYFWDEIERKTILK